MQYIMHQQYTVYCWCIEIIVSKLCWKIPLIPYPILRIIFYVVYSMKWTQESWLHTRCKLPRDVVTMVLWSRAIFTYFWFKKWRIISTAPKLIKFWSLFWVTFSRPSSPSDLKKKIHVELKRSDSLKRW